MPATAYLKNSTNPAKLWVGLLLPDSFWSSHDELGTIKCLMIVGRFGSCDLLTKIVIVEARRKFLYSQVAFPKWKRRPIYTVKSGDDYVKFVVEDDRLAVKAMSCPGRKPGKTLHRK